MVWPRSAGRQWGSVEARSEIHCSGEAKERRDPPRRGQGTQPGPGFEPQRPITTSLATLACAAPATSAAPSPRPNPNPNPNLTLTLTLTLTPTTADGMHEEGREWRRAVALDSTRCAREWVQLSLVRPRPPCVPRGASGDAPAHSLVAGAYVQVLE